MTTDASQHPSLSSPYTYFHVLLRDPLVCVVSSGILFPSGVYLALKEAQGNPCHIVVQPAWNLERHAAQLAKQVAVVRKKNRNIQFMFLCPTLAELNAIQATGLDGLLIHKNTFIDDNIFKPDAAIQKKYSSIHVANTEKFKRHHLAWNIEPPRVWRRVFCLS